MARRAREKAERLQRFAAAWEAGAVGEKATGQVLSHLDSSVWTTWHDVRWPGRQRANIDHVVIGPSGVFVVDSKNWSGTVLVKDGVLRQNGYSREKAVAGVAEAAIAVHQLVPYVPVHPVLCLVRDEPVELWVRNVMLSSPGTLDHMLRTQPGVLTQEQVREAVALLEAGLTGEQTETAPRRVPGLAGRTSMLRPLLGLLMIVLMVMAVSTGLFSSGLQWVGDRVSDVVIEDPTPDRVDPERKRERRNRPDNQRQDSQRQ